MRTRSLNALLLVVLAAAPSAAAVTDPIVRPQSRLWVEGTSTLRSFTCRATDFSSDFETASPGAGALILSGTKAVRKAEVSAAAKRLECGNGTMNDHMFKAIRASEHPEIRFTVSSYELAPAGDSVVVRLNGSLLLGGTERAIAVEALARPGENGTVQVTGSTGVKLSEYGLKAPTLMMGTIKVHDQMRIGFDLLLKL